MTVVTALNEERKDYLDEIEASNACRLICTLAGFEQLASG